MDPPVNQAELLRCLEHEYQRYDALLALLSPDDLLIPGVVGDWTIKDLVAHFIAHEQFALCELQHALRGERYHPDYDDTTLMNAHAVTERHDQSGAAVLQAWKASYQEIVAAV